MSIPNPASGSENSKPLWQSIVDCAKPGVAAAIAIVNPPITYAFIAKGERQRSQPLPSFHLATVAKIGAVSSPSTGAAVAIQVNAQEWLLRKIQGEAEAGKPASFQASFISSLGAGVISAVPYILMNGTTNKQSIPYIIKNMTLYQVAAVSGRETGFVLALTCSDEVSKQANERLGQHPVVSWVTRFTTGYLGSVAGHPLDTWLTLMQKNIKVVGVRQLYQGANIRGVGVGLISCQIKVILDAWNNLANQK